MMRLAHCLLAGFGSGLFAAGLDLSLSAAVGMTLMACAIIFAIHSEATS